MPGLGLVFCLVFFPTVEKSTTNQKALSAEIVPLRWWKFLQWMGLVLCMGDSPEQAVEIFSATSPVLPPALHAPAFHRAFSHG